MKPNHCYSPNLHPDKLKALQNLRRNKNIIIKRADKSGHVVVWDIQHYLDEAYGQILNGPYVEIEREYIYELQQTISNKLNELFADTELIARLTVPNPRYGRFYMLPKTHTRDSICKGRPIVSNCQAVTEKVSKYLNTILNPLVRKEPHYLISTDHFIREFETIRPSIPRNCQIVTLDIEQLIQIYRQKWEYQRAKQN
ncbi:hypothetical protein GJ496_005175 [Pomphorhynchus laevis]|nr:hypothetical protein GJ496_005175 [Pomphorhynchus laevis]